MRSNHLIKQKESKLFLFSFKDCIEIKSLLLPEVGNAEICQATQENKGESEISTLVMVNFLKEVQSAGQKAKA